MQTIYVKGEAEYTPIPFRELVDLASAAQSHGDLYKDFDNQSKFREWAHSILLEITQGTGMEVKSGSKNILSDNGDEQRNRRMPVHSWNSV